MSNQYTPAPISHLQGVVPPRGASRTTVDLAPGFAPSWIVLQRIAWERVLLIRIVLDGADHPVLPTQEGDQMFYRLPHWTNVELAKTRRLELSWTNKTAHGTQFAYLVTDVRPQAPTVGPANQPAATVLGPATGMMTPMALPSQQATAIRAPMSPPAFPLPVTAAPVLGGSIAPALPAVPSMAGPAIPAPVAPQAPPPPSPAQPPPTEVEAHVAGCLRVDYLLVRQLAEGLSARFGLQSDTLLNAYVENFGSAGLELVPRQWVEEARARAQETGIEPSQMVAGIVLQRLAERVREDRDFHELNKPGAAAMLLASAPQPGGPDFVVKTSTSPAPAPTAATLPALVEESPPETSRTGEPAKATNGELQELARLLQVRTAWLLVVLRTIAQARNLIPDLLLHALAGPVMAQLLRDRYLAEAKADVEKKLADAALAQANPSDSTEAPKLNLPLRQDEIQQLINEAVATRSIDHVARGIAGITETAQAVVAGLDATEIDETEAPPPVG